MRVFPVPFRSFSYGLLVGCVLAAVARAEPQPDPGLPRPGHRPAADPATPPPAGGHSPRWFHPRRYVEPYWTLADRVRKAEIVEMLVALTHGSPPVAGKGWFHSGLSRYGWPWLRQRYDEDGDEAISREEFPSEAADYFARLDRDEDGWLKSDDFEWSEDAPFVKQTAQARRFFDPLDRDRNGQLTRAEWQDFFDRAALGGDALTPDDLRAALFPPEPAKADDGPTPLGLLKGFLSGELGSICEGPGLGRPAPDFDLAENHGERRIRLADLRGQKPVVLIFGSFT